MPNFKPKANKKIKMNKKSTITLDSKHSQKMSEFKKIKEIRIPALLNRKKLLKKKLKITKNIEDRLNMEDEIREIKKKIGILKVQKDDYLLENSNIIFEYFEKKKKMSEGIDIDKKKFYILFLIQIKQ